LGTNRSPLSVTYPFWIDVTYDTGRSFWQVSSVEYWRYDLRETVYEQEVLAAFGLANIPLCCWCDDAANGDPVWYAGKRHPACREHGKRYSQAIRYANEDFDRINQAVRVPA